MRMPLLWWLPLFVWEAERKNFHLPKLMGPELGQMGMDS